MTCAQGLLRLLWGGPKLECYGTDYIVEQATRNNKILIHETERLFYSTLDHIVREINVRVNQRNSKPSTLRFNQNSNFWV